MGTTALSRIVTVLSVISPAIVAFVRKAGANRSGSSLWRSWAVGFRAALREWRGTLRVGGAITLGLWICVFFWAFANVIYTDHTNVVGAVRGLRVEALKKSDEITKLEKRDKTLEAEVQALKERPAGVVIKEPEEHCWITWMGAFPNRSIARAKSAGYTILQCNRRIEPPFEVIIVFDRKPLEVTMSILDAPAVIGDSGSIQGSVFRTRVSSPPLLAHRLVVVLAHGEDEVSPPKPLRGALRALR